MRDAAEHSSALAILLRQHYPVSEKHLQNHDQRRSDLCGARRMSLSEAEDPYETLKVPPLTRRVQDHLWPQYDHQHDVHAQHVHPLHHEPSVGGHLLHGCDSVLRVFPIFRGSLIPVYHRHDRLGGPVYYHVKHKVLLCGVGSRAHCKLCFIHLVEAVFGQRVQPKLLVRCLVHYGNPYYLHSLFHACLCPLRQMEIHFLE